MLRHSRFAVGLFVLLASASVSFAASEEETQAKYYFGFNGELNPKQIEGLRADLRKAQAECATIGTLCPPANRVLKALFGETFRDQLPDVLVYIEKQDDGSLETYRPLLLWKGENTPYVFGARHLYVLIISDEELSLDASLTTIVEGSTNPLAGILTLLNFKPAEPAGKEPKSNIAQVGWTHLGKRHDDPYLGWARLDIELDSVNRLTLFARSETVTRTVDGPPGAHPTPKITRSAAGPEPLPGEGGTIPFRQVTAHLSNSKLAHAAFGVALGTTFDVSDTAVGEGGGDVHHNAYALAKLYLRRPRLKVGPDHHSQYRISVGVVLGTNVTNDPFEELIGGLSVGHIIGKLGITVGVNVLKPKAETDDMADGGGSEDRGSKHKFFLGVDYSF